MKKAFTMIELVFVIVVIGIIAATVIPRTDSNSLAEATADLVSKIRYAQHLAMVDDNFGVSADWYKKRWQIRFDGNTYSVVNNNNTTYAVDPSNNGKSIQDIDLEDKYGVTVAISGTECGTAMSSGEYGIGFDYLGRPITGDLNTLTGAYSGTNAQFVKTNDCAIVLSNGTDTATINITPETGYTKVTY